MNADLRGLHIDALKAIRSAFDGIPAPCAERDALDYAITELSVAQGEGFVVDIDLDTSAGVRALAFRGKDSGLRITSDKGNGAWRTEQTFRCKFTLAELHEYAAPAQPDGVE